MIDLNEVPASTILYIPFTSYDSNGASLTMTGLTTAKIKIYKNGSTTERASTNGFTLLDGDGIDFDAITGLHGFSIDLSDNTDAGFYAVGSWYWVVVSTITINTQTVTMIAATFRIKAAEAVTGQAKVDVTSIAGSTVNTASAQLGVNVVNAGGTAWGSGAITAGSIASNAITAAKVATDAIGAAQLATDAVTEIQTGLATAASLTAVFDQAIEGSVTARQMMRLWLSALAGKTAGGGTANLTFRDNADTKNRIAATVNPVTGDRTAITLDVT